MEQNSNLNKLFTGKHDKFGQSIYEGDFVKTSHGVFCVRFYNSAFALVKENGDHFEYMCNMSDMMGRIYEKIDKSN